MRGFVAAWFALTLAAPVAAGAAPVLEAQVVGMLSAIESMPPPSAWHALGDGCVPVLAGVVDDAQQPTFRRARAAVVLGYFADPAAADVLERVLRDDTADAALRRHALVGLGHASPARTLPYLERALTDADVPTRQVAIKVLGEMPGGEARALLERHRVREARPLLRAQVEAALAHP